MEFCIFDIYIYFLKIASHPKSFKLTTIHKLNWWRKYRTSTHACDAIYDIYVIMTLWKVENTSGTLFTLSGIVLWSGYWIDGLISHLYHTALGHYGFGFTCYPMQLVRNGCESKAKRLITQRLPKVREFKINVTKLDEFKWFVTGHFKIEL